MSFFHRPRIKQWGWVLLACLASYAAGNYHVTREAVDGSARWWQWQEHKAVDRCENGN